MRVCVCALSAHTHAHTHTHTRTHIHTHTHTGAHLAPPGATAGQQEPRGRCLKRHPKHRRPPPPSRRASARGSGTCRPTAGSGRQMRRPTAPRDAPAARRGAARARLGAAGGQGARGAHPAPLLPQVEAAHFLADPAERLELLAVRGVRREAAARGPAPHAPPR